MTSIWDWVVLAGLIIASAFFSAAETALTGVNRIRLRTMVESGEKRAFAVQELISRPQRLLATILVGNNIANIAASALFTAMMIELVGTGGAITIATGVLTVIILVFGEIAPKSVAALNPELLSCRVAPFVRWLTRLLFPAVWLLTLLSSSLMRMLGVPARMDNDVTEDEIRTLVNVGEELGVIEGTESKMIRSVLELTDTPVRNVMVPRTAITAIDVKISHQGLLDVIRREGYSRLPVYDGDIDNIIGLLHVKDVCALTDDERLTFELSKHLRPTIFVFESKRSGLVLRELQKHRVYMAIIIDEYGGTAGLVTIEDLIEEIVGEIVDEYDVEDPPVEVLDEFTTFFDARLTVEEVNQQLDIQLPVDRAETIGGLIYDQLGRIPKVGDSTAIGRVQLAVDRMDRRSIERVKVTIKPKND
ncbi:MAG: hemolysin family protein [Bacillota bacterium]|jgi:putative hemolysin